MSAVVLTPMEFFVSWEDLAPGARPLVLDVVPDPATEEEAEQIRRTAWIGLADKGLGWPGQLNSWYTDLLHQFARPRTAIDLRFNLDRERSLRAMVTGSGEFVACGSVMDNQVRISEIGPTTMPEAAAELLPEHPPGHGDQITVPNDLLQYAAARAGKSYDAFAHELELGGMPPGPARALAQTVSAERLRGGQFGATGWDHWGERNRAEHVVSVVDNVEGRYSVRAIGQYTTVAPADPASLVENLSELLISVN
ncbi:ESX secretion-associated protein EspG [Crossiella sp. SN42]|uniref:ESX secretion-associated protein EspG n=1 Tax=Crossiella sp. SN42 TaxID=2944808 RepID=UPI0027DF0217|nr:ESX secretion-associated protein EspG [Crossiella sp. SN42]